MMTNLQRPNRGKQQGKKSKSKTKISNKIVVAGKPDNTGNEK